MFSSGLLPDRPCRRHGPGLTPGVDRTACGPAGSGRASFQLCFQSRRPCCDDRRGSMRDRSAGQPWRCLWRRFSQITMTRPCRRITLHLSQIFLTLGLTFTSSILVLVVVAPRGSRGEASEPFSTQVLRPC